MININVYAKNKTVNGTTSTSSGFGGQSSGNYSSDNIETNNITSNNIKAGNITSQTITSSQATFDDVAVNNGITSYTGNISYLNSFYVDTAGYIHSSGDINTDENINALGYVKVGNYLNVANDITTNGNAVITKQLSVFGDIKDSLNLSVTGYTNIGGYLSVDGNVSTKSNLNVNGTSKFNGDVSTVNINNKDNITTKNLTVTGSAHFFQLIIDKIKSIGGSFIASPADGFDVDVVEKVTGGYKLYWKQNDGQQERINQWETGDQAVCMNFNGAKVGTSHSISNHYYWALVTATNEGNAPVDKLSDGSTYIDSNHNLYNYIQISTTDCDGTVNPEKGDTIVQLGNRNDSASNPNYRGSAEYIASYKSIDSGLTPPLFAQYRNIGSVSGHYFDLAYYRKSYFDAKKAKFVGEFEVTSGQSIEEYIMDKIDNASAKAPYISDGSDGFTKDNWIIWSNDKLAYVDSGVKAKGQQGDTGKNGISMFRSYAFLRTSVDESANQPTGGDWDNPVPTSWYDSIPDGTDTLWETTAVFIKDSDGKVTHTKWSTPRKVGNTSDTRIIYSEKENPDKPLSEIGADGITWLSTASKNTIWMAMRNKVNGVWGDWNVMKIKGESGKDGKDGKDGTSLNIKGSCIGHFYTLGDLRNAFYNGTAKTYGNYLIDENILLCNYDGTYNNTKCSVGDTYIVSSSDDASIVGHVFAATDKKWIDCGNIKGEKGDKGETGDNGLMYQLLPFIENCYFIIDDNGDKKVHLNLAYKIFKFEGKSVTEITKLQDIRISTMTYDSITEYDGAYWILNKIYDFNETISGWTIYLQVKNTNTNSYYNADVRFVPLVFEQNSIFKITDNARLSAISDGKKYTDGEITTVNNKYSSLKQTVDGFSSDIEDLQTKYNTVNGNVTSVTDKYNTLKSTVDGNTSSIGSLQKNYDSVSGNLTGLTSKYNTLKSTVDGNTSSIGSLQKNYDSVSGNLTGLTSKYNTLKSTVDGNNSSIGSLQKNYDSVSGSVTDLTSKYSELKHTADGLSSTVTNINSIVSGKNLIQYSGGKTSDNFTSSEKTAWENNILKLTHTGSSNNWFVYYPIFNQYNSNKLDAGKYIITFKPKVAGTANADKVTLRVGITSSTNITDNPIFLETSYREKWNNIMFTEPFEVKSDGDVNIFFHMTWYTDNSVNNPVYEIDVYNVELYKVVDDASFSYLKQTANSFSVDIKNKLGQAGVFIGSEDSSTVPHIELNGNTKINGDLKVAAQNNADAITLINSSGQTAIQLMNKSIDDTITNVKSGKFGGTSQILFGWGTETHTNFYRDIIATDVCYIQAGKQYVISGMTFSKNTDGAGSISPVTITLIEGGTVLKSYTDGQVSNLNGTYTATHTGRVKMTASFSTQFTVMGRHPSFLIKGSVTRDSDSIIAFGDGGFAFGVGTNKNMYMNKNEMVVRWGNDGVRFDDYGMTRLCADGGNEVWTGERHKIVVANSSGYWWQTEESMSYDTILVTYNGGDAYINIAPPYYIDGMTINIIDKCSGNCYVNFMGKAFIRANDSATSKDTSTKYELDGRRTFKFMWSSTLGAWLEIA